MAASSIPVDASIALEPTPPFAFDQTLAFVDGFVPCADDRLCRDGTLVTGGYADGDPFVATVAVDRPRADRDGADALAVDVRWPAGDGDPAAVAGSLRRFLSLEDDLRPLYRAAAGDSAFGSVVETLYGYHHVRFPTPFEAACWAALSQRTPWTVAQHQKRALVEAAGRVVSLDGYEVTCFPSPDRVLAAREAVAEAIAHERKSKTILGAASAFASSDLRALDDVALRERLAEIWGFGDWSSEFVALRGFGRMDRLPTTEQRLREVVADLYDLDADGASDDDLAELCEPYAQLPGYWAHYVRVWLERAKGEAE